MSRAVCLGVLACALLPACLLADGLQGAGPFTSKVQRRERGAAKRAGAASAFWPGRCRLAGQLRAELW